MRHDGRYSNDRGTTTVRWRGAACLAGLIAAGVLVAGCGGNSPSGGVASLGSQASKTSTTSTTAPRPAGNSGGGESSPDSQAVAFSACVRAHGVPDFPDPKVTTHGNSVSVAIAINPAISGNPRFKSAQQACRKLMPGGGPGGEGNQHITPQEQGQYLNAAACIRSHGLPNFPDPTFSGGGVHIDHQGLNESSPAFKTAVHDCESLIPGGLHGGSGSAQEAAPRSAP
jgi:hypothetical protein